MTNFTATQARKAGAIIPGGVICQGEVLGAKKSVFKIQQLTQAVGGTQLSDEQNAIYGAGGLRSLRLVFSCVVAKGKLWVETLAQVGGPSASKFKHSMVANDEVVFSSKLVPGGAGC